MPRSTVPGLEKYDQRLARAACSTSSRRRQASPCIAWVRKHQPRIELGQPITGGGFTYPWPLDYIVITPVYDDEWLRGAHRPRACCT